MKIITEKSVRENFMKYGFKSADEQTIEIMNKSFGGFLKKTLAKAEKVAKGGIIKEEHVMKAIGGGSKQSGGRVTMPLEYYGVNSGHYHENPEMGANMDVTDTTIRPAMNVNDPSGLIEKFDMTGGAGCPFSLSKNATTKACKQFGASIPVKAREHIQKKFESEFHEIMSKLKKSGGKNNYHLSGGALDKVLSQSKYSKLFKE